MTSPGLIEQDYDVFRRQFNRKPFEVQHHIATNRLFEIEPLIDLAKRVAERKNAWGPHGDVYWDLGPKAINAAPHCGPREISVDAAVRQIATSSAWVFVKHLEREPEYRKVLEGCMCDCLRYSSRDLFRKIKWFEAILFITSPHRVTPYHIDRECSWLLQIAGRKKVHVFDPDDRLVTPEQELEEYWRGTKRASYKPELEDRATVFHLTPGSGVHIPVNAPHWLENDDNVSISLNVNFQFCEWERGDIYRANYFLRRAGISPKRPGTAFWSDGCKRLVMGLAYARKRVDTKVLAQERRVEKQRIRNLLQGIL